MNKDLNTETIGESFYQHKHFIDKQARRDFFAAMAMQAIIVAATVERKEGTLIPELEKTSQSSVKYADALIEALDKKENEK